MAPPDLCGRATAGVGQGMAEDHLSGDVRHLPDRRPESAPTRRTP